jgi:hypothetical protein
VLQASFAAAAAAQAPVLETSVVRQRQHFGKECRILHGRGCLREQSIELVVWNGGNGLQLLIALEFVATEVTWQNARLSICGRALRRPS